MRFLTFFTPAPQSAPPSPEYMEEMNKLIDASMRSGELVATGGLTPLQQGARVNYKAGNATITDGPYIESTEIIGGFALLELPSKEAAIESAKNFLKVAGEGYVTIRPLMGLTQTCTGEEALAMRVER